MKAILVIDIPDDLKYEDLYFDGEIRYTSEFDRGYVFLKETGRCLLKPMPQERDIFEQGYDEEDTRDISQWNKGYNACIDEILGEE